MGFFPNLILKLGFFQNYCSKQPPSCPYKHKTIFMLFLFTFPASHPFLYSIFLFKPQCHQWATMRQTLLELQSIKVEVGPNIIFGLFYVKFLTISHIFPHLVISIFRNIFSHCFCFSLLFTSFTAILEKKWFVIIQRFKPLRCRHLLKFLGKMKFSREN